MTSLLCFDFSMIWYILLAFLALMIIIIVHELGHYTVGKLFHFSIKEFGIGFGKPIISKKMKSGEVFTLRPILLGGFCAFEGEDEDNESENAFNNKPCYQRILVLVAGVTFNLIFAMLILGLFFSIYGYVFPTVKKVFYSDDTQVVQVLEEGDVLLKVNGKNIYTSTVSNLSKLVGDNDSVVFTIDRGGEVMEVEATKSTYNYVYDNGEVTTEYGFGIITTISYYKIGFFPSLWRGIYYCFQIIGVIFETIGGLLTGVLGIKGSLGGPITTISMMSSSFQQYGVMAFINMLGVISASLAFMNILPLPALDGSRIVFVIIEWIRGKPIKRELEGTIHFVGLIILFGLTILFDLINLF